MLAKPLLTAVEPTIETNTRDLIRRDSGASASWPIAVLSAFLACALLLTPSTNAGAQQPSGFIAEVIPQFGGEPGDLICFDLFRLGDPNLELVIIIGLSEVFGTSQVAIEGEDYELVNVQAIFGRGEAHLQVCPVQVLDDTLREGTESLALTFLALESISRQQTIRRSQTEILDDDLVGPDLGVSLLLQAGEPDVAVVVENFGTETLTGIELLLEGKFTAHQGRLLNHCVRTVVGGPTQPPGGTRDAEIACKFPSPLAPNETLTVFALLETYSLVSPDAYAVLATVRDDGSQGVDEEPRNNSVEIAIPSIPGSCRVQSLPRHCSCYFTLLWQAVGSRLTRVLGFDGGRPSAKHTEQTPGTWISKATRSTLGQFMSSAGSLLKLYKIRERMTNTPGGQRGVDLYYRHTAEIRSLVLGSPSLLADSLFVMDEWSEHLSAFAAGMDTDTVITSSQIDVLEALLDRLESEGSMPFAQASHAERERLDLRSLVGENLETAFARLDQLSCVPGLNTLCLDDGRFSVNVAWIDFEGNRGLGRPVHVTRDTGAFWFFDDQNLELLVKVLDGTAVNGAHWVFYGALSNVGYEIGVTDTLTGQVRIYRNEPGEFGSGGDIDAFPSLSRPGPIAPTRATDLDFSPLVLGGRSVVPAQAGACADDSDTLCLGDGRFEVTVQWEDFQGGTGSGNAVPLTTDTGSFWFFDQDNLELMVKVLDATVINGHYWVFYGALSNVAYSIEVRDTSTGEVATYVNPEGAFGSVGDIEALPEVPIP